MKMLNLSALCFAATLTACESPAPTPAAEAPAAQKAPSKPSGAPSSQPAQARGAKPTAVAFTGTVLETISAASYTYLRLQTKSGERWAAVPASTLATGTTVTIEQPLKMQGFKSKTLDRTFPVIYFGRIAGQGSTAAGQPAKPTRPASGSQPIKANQPAAAPSAPVKAAPGATQIAQIHKTASQLSGKSVKVTGRVVKFSAQILKRNWAHLQDGSGTAAAGDHDLTVTLQGQLKVGDVVTVQGVLRQNKDFGAGYKYAVILEEAVVVE